MKTLFLILISTANRVSNEKLLEILAWVAVPSAIFAIIWCLNYFFKKILNLEEEK